MNKKAVLPILLAVLGLALRFCFTGVGFIGYTLIFAAVVIFIVRFAKSKLLRRLVCILTAVGLVYFAAVEIPIIRASSGDGNTAYDYIIVLGAAVHGDTPSLSLIERMSAARDYLNEHGDTVAVVSGGQGTDENLSEAQAMYNWLTENGVEPDRIIIEDQSSSTRENLENSFRLIRSRDGDSASVAVVTSEYHIYRAKLIAASLGDEVGAVSARTTYFQIRLNYFIREAFGVTYQWMFG